MTKLPYKVECRSTLPYFETIAAFDCYSAAIDYVETCAKAHPSWQYAMKKNNKTIASFSREKNAYMRNMIDDLSEVIRDMDKAEPNPAGETWKQARKRLAEKMKEAE